MMRLFGAREDKAAAAGPAAKQARTTPAHLAKSMRRMGQLASEERGAMADSLAQLQEDMDEVKEAVQVDLDEQIRTLLETVQDLRQYERRAQTDALELRQDERRARTDALTQMQSAVDEVKDVIQVELDKQIRALIGSVQELRDDERCAYAELLAKLQAHDDAVQNELAVQIQSLAGAVKEMRSDERRAQAETLRELGAVNDAVRCLSAALAAESAPAPAGTCACHSKTRSESDLDAPLQVRAAGKHPKPA